MNLPRFYTRAHESSMRLTIEEGERTRTFHLSDLDSHRCVTLTPTTVVVTATPPPFSPLSVLIDGVFGLVASSVTTYVAVIKRATVVAKIGEHRLCRVDEVELYGFVDEVDELKDGLTKFLGSGDFYFSRSYNLTVCAQRTSVANESADVDFFDFFDAFDAGFFWNRFMLSRFIEAQLRPFIIPIIKGCIRAIPRVSVEGEACDLILVSRVGCENAGTRFNARGINDDGAVANYVETEMIAVFDQHFLSFVQVRGSVPLYWEQRFVKTSYQVSLARNTEATAPAFARHFARERRRLALPVVGVCLLNQKSDKEQLLLRALNDQIEMYNQAVVDGDVLEGEETVTDLLEYEFFDVRMHCKSMQFAELRPFLRKMEDRLLQHAYFWRKRGAHATDVLSTQRGVLRTNCLDALDRTNFVQTAFAWSVLVHGLRQLGLITADSASVTDTPLYHNFLRLWEENGVQLSTHYAGASSSKSKYTRNESTGRGRFLSGMLDAAKTTTQRLYSNAFLDGSRQEAMDAILGKDEAARHAVEERVNDAFRDAMHARLDDYTTAKARHVLCATWNVNAQMPSPEDITPWLVPDGLPPPDVYVIGFQEIVDLTTGNVLGTTDESNSVAWVNHIQRVVSERTADNYIHVKTRQLVGVLLMVFVRKALVGQVRALSTGVIKLGYGGMTGNKGAIGVRLELGSTSMVFVCAHLAAGQSHVEERNANWNDGERGLSFGKRQQWNVESHDLAIWMGDFNYRINMPRADIIERVKLGQLAPLIACDQLLLERAAGHCFHEYREGPLTFPPTYKYDVGTDTYDTSEKARSPAWTDRVLYRVAPRSALNVALLDYSRSELRASDHKPVRAVFRIGVRYVDETKQKAVAREVRRQIAAQQQSDHDDVDVDVDALMRKQEARMRSNAAFGSSVTMSVPSGEAPDELPTLDLLDIGEMSSPSSLRGSCADEAPSVDMSHPVLDQPATWAISKADCARFAGIFRAIDTDKDGFVGGGEARPVFVKSGLPNNELAAIWQLCDREHVGRLDIRQFALGLWLCNARMRGGAMVDEVPERLLESLQAGGYEFCSPVDSGDSGDSVDDSGDSRSDDGESDGSGDAPLVLL